MRKTRKLSGHDLISVMMKMEIIEVLSSYY